MTSALLLSALLAAPASAAEGLTVSSYTAAALESSPDVRTARETWKAADAAYKGQAAAMLLPTLSFTWNQYPYGHDQLDSYRYKHGPVAWRDGQSLATADWNLFNGFQDLEKTRAAALTRASAERAWAAAKQDRAFAAISAFYELDSKSELLAVAEQNLKAQKEQYDQSLDLYKHGMKSLADLLKSETDWRSSQLRLVAAQSERKKALVEFNTLVDRPGLQDAVLSVDLRPGATELPSLAADLDRAYAQRPELARARKDADKARVAGQQAWLAALPTFKVDATWNKSELPRGAGSASPNPNHFVGLALSMPLGFNLFTQAWAVAAARAATRQAEAAEDAVLRTVRSEVYGAFIDLEKAVSSYSFAALKEEIAAKSLEIVGRQYQQGAADAIRMNQAQNDYLNARVERALALHDIFIVRARYARSVGDPLWRD